MTRNHDAIIKGIQQFRGRKYDYTPRNEFEEKYAYYPTETVERIRNQVSLSAIEGLDRPHGYVEGGSQGADSAQRGLHQHGAAADARSDGGVARDRQPGAQRSGCRREQHRPKIAPRFSANIDMEIGTARGVRHRQPQQHGDLRGRSARPGDQ